MSIKAQLASQLSGFGSLTGAGRCAVCADEIPPNTGIDAGPLFFFNLVEVGYDPVASGRLPAERWATRWHELRSKERLVGERLTHPMGDYAAQQVAADAASVVDPTRMERDPYGVWKSEVSERLNDPGVRWSMCSACADDVHSFLDPHPVGERRAYLVLLWDAREWSDAEQQEIVAGKRAELGLPTELLTAVHVDGAIPTEPDTYVVSTALLACKDAGVEFDSERDEISFKGGEYQHGVGLGLITIIVRAVAR